MEVNPSSLTFIHTNTRTLSNRWTSESALTATTPFTTLWWIGRWLGVLTRALNPRLCLLKCEVVWMGNGAGWLKRGPPNGSYQANRETGERENEWERKECWGCHWLVDCNQSTKCERGIDPSLRSDKQTADGGHPVHVQWGDGGTAEPLNVHWRLNWELMNYSLSLKNIFYKMNAFIAAFRIRMEVQWHVRNLF